MARDVLSDLQALGDRRQAARDELRATSPQIAELVRQAHAAGVPKVKIAALAKISRPALDAMLKP